MNGFLYGIMLQWKLDIRSKSLLVTCYIVPFFFFLFMGGIFTSVMPGMRSTLIQSMIVMSVSMGAFIGLPPSLIETYGSDINKIYKANGIPVYLGLVTMFISTFVHLMISCAVIVLLAPRLFEAVLPEQLSGFLFCTCYIHYCVVKHGKYFRANYKKPSKADNDSAVSISAFNYAFRDYVPH